MTFKLAVFLISCIALSTLPVTYAESMSNQQSEQQTITLELQNMTCSLCSFTIKKALQNVAGVQQVKVDFDTKTAIVNFDPRQTNSETLIKATTHAGYPATKRLLNQ